MNKNKKRLIIIVLVLFIVVSFFSLWTLINEGYDKQNKVVLFIKKFIPTQTARKIRDTIFIIPKLQEDNKILKLVVEKYETNLQGKLFNEETIKTEKNNNYKLKEFLIPFQRINLDKGWNDQANTFTKHYLETIDDKVLLLSGAGETIYFKKANINKTELKLLEIPNNIKEIIKKNNIQSMGVRDLFLDNDNKIYISLFFKGSNGYSVNVYQADVSFEQLTFEPLFVSKLFWNNFTVRTGGRISSYKDNKILLTIGDLADEKSPQDIKSLKGKIISINKNNGEYKIISMGHRNQQGLFYLDKNDTIINSEHGPKGGDEININNNSIEISNFGWAISSYGTTYDDKEIYEKSHGEFGFIEPLIKYVPSIGISQIDYYEDESKNENIIFTSSLRASSIYINKVNKTFTEVEDQERIYISNERIRDIKYDKETNSIFCIFESVPSFAVIKLK